MLSQKDPEVYAILQKEDKRQRDTLTLIPSENYSSLEVRATLSSVFTNKYSEGYPKKRYYQGNANADDIELLAIARAKKLFNVVHVNVQPYSGSPANTAVYFALLKPLEDKIMGLALSSGGHLTHGSPVSFSGKYFKTISFPVTKDGVLDYDAIEKLAITEKPKIIVCGFTAYPRIIDFERFGKIADKVDAYLLADISHIAGLIAGGAHPSPAKHAHIIMTTTHKSLRGPRGAMLMITQKGIEKDPELPAKIDKAVFPGLQGGPHDNQTAAIAVALHEATTIEFGKYAKQIVANAKALSQELLNYGFKLTTNGTENHLIVIDTMSKNVNGALAAYALELAGIITNKNTIPYDTLPPFYPSGVRIGTPGATTRGMREKDMVMLAKWINEVIVECKGNGFDKLTTKEERGPFFKQFKKDISENKTIKKIALEVKKYLKDFPMP
ncbi:MAG: serine hydroxymethyltransferase [Candidatus Levybacteria bacterium]|nr:serine hydroxymethyltransferase [Candidatus Levybacteria bacterium]